MRPIFASIRNGFIWFPSPIIILISNLVRTRTGISNDRTLSINLSFFLIGKFDFIVIYFFRKEITKTWLQILE